LLAYLAVAAAEQTPVRRDVLVGLFWPELPTDRARAALRQVLFQLRRTVGESVFHVGRETVALVPDALTSDVTIFEQRLARAERAGAMEIYRGTLFDGFFVDGMSAAFEEWLDSARARLTAKAFAACSALADDAERDANGIAAAQWARAASALAPDDEIAVRRLIQTLDRFGDRCGALRVADDFARRLSVEFDAAPSAETQALVAAIRARRGPPALVVADAVDVRPSPGPIDNSATPPDAAATPAARYSRRDGLRRRITASMQRRALVATVTASVIFIALLATHGRNAVAGPRSAMRTMTPPITIASTTARGLYDQGLDRYYAGDARESARLFTAALDADSSCAMCAYYAGMAEGDWDNAAAGHMFEVANRLAVHVSEPERLLIHYRWADATNSSTRRAIADSLVARYPDWPDAQAVAAEAAGMDGAWLTAAEHLRRAIAGEPLPRSGVSATCPACTTRFLLVGMYANADSVSAALRAAQALEREQPRSRPAWLTLSHQLAASGRYDDARAAIDSATRYSTGTEADVVEHAILEIRARNFATADGLLAALAQTGNADRRSDALWFLGISLRAQGRVHEALDVADGAFRRADSAFTGTVATARVAEAQARFELGQFRRAASIFESLVVPPDTFSRAAEGRSARQRVWVLTHTGSALAAAGDTVALAALVDTVETWGRKSGFGRDHHLYEYLRGLLWTARARPDSALAAFTRATFSETEGFSRIDLQRARTLLSLGRPREAIPVLRHPLSGSIEAGNFYATQTELQELLAQAYDAAGEPDSAAVYYRYVLTAWRGADREFQPRVARDRELLAADERRLRSRKAPATVALSP
ncbi:MAG TPA: BTAD domain-containing putative transcriptional regulator, partial [Gemmatimonadaceae bacterium]|nr:BTAD domain-containing putative transcriptional regulator [Gemmatimonadaceae bacterium]